MCKDAHLKFQTTVYLIRKRNDIEIERGKSLEIWQGHLNNKNTSEELK